VINDNCARGKVAEWEDLAQNQFDLDRSIGLCGLLFHLFQSLRNNSQKLKAKEKNRGPRYRDPNGHNCHGGHEQLIRNAYTARVCFEMAQDPEEHQVDHDTYACITPSNAVPNGS